MVILPVSFVGRVKIFHIYSSNASLLDAYGVCMLVVYWSTGYPYFH
jgi:hypothetical protein